MLVGFSRQLVAAIRFNWRMLMPRCSAWVTSARLASGYRNFAWAMALAMLLCHLANGTCHAALSICPVGSPMRHVLEQNALPLIT